MILLLTLPAAFAVAVLRGGRLSRFTSLPLRWPAVPALAFAAQIAVIYFPEPRGQGLISPHVALLILSYLALLWSVWVNRHIPGMILLCLGLVLNLTVMLLNGGYMPITPEAVERIGHGDLVTASGPGARVSCSKDIVLPKEDTQLWLLSDVFVLPPPFPIPTAFSPGDVLVAAGVFLLVQHALLGTAARGKRGTDAPERPRRARGLRAPSGPCMVPTGGVYVGEDAGEDTEQAGWRSGL